MNATFETIRKELKKYNAEENEVPPKLVLAGKDDLLDIGHKRKQNSQFIISIKEYSASEKYVIEKIMDEIQLRTGQPPLAFFYDKKEAIKTVVEDFQDYYNMDLGHQLLQTVDAAKKDGSQFCLIIVVFETPYYK